MLFVSISVSVPAAASSVYAVIVLLISLMRYAKCPFGWNAM